MKKPPNYQLCCSFGFDRGDNIHDIKRNFHKKEPLRNNRNLENPNIHIVFKFRADWQPMRIFLDSPIHAPSIHITLRYLHLTTSWSLSQWEGNHNFLDQSLSNNPYIKSNRVKSYTRNHDVSNFPQINISYNSGP